MSELAGKQASNCVTYCADPCVLLFALNHPRIRIVLFNLSNQMSHFYDKKLAEQSVRWHIQICASILGTIRSNLCVYFPSSIHISPARSVASSCILCICDSTQLHVELNHSHSIFHFYRTFTNFHEHNLKLFFHSFFFVVGVIRSTSISFHECNNMLVNVSRSEWERATLCVFAHASECVTFFEYNLPAIKWKWNFHEHRRASRTLISIMFYCMP